MNRVVDINKLKKILFTQLFCFFPYNNQIQIKMEKDFLKSFGYYIEELLKDKYFEFNKKIKQLEDKVIILESRIENYESSDLELKFLNRNQIAELCNVKYRTVANWCEKGLIVRVANQKHIVYNYKDTIKELGRTGKLKKGSVK